MSNTIALVFDFDDTLTDDSSSRLLKEHGVDVNDFWDRRVASRITDGWDATLAFLEEILALTQAGQPLAGLSNSSLREFGKTIQFYPGLPSIFADLRAIAHAFPLTEPHIEIYVISGGFEELIRGSSISSELTAFWGVVFEEDPATHAIMRPRRLVDFTTKTRYLFEINKGVFVDGRRNPFLVNESVAPENRRVPFPNLIYCGDGLTDVPAFSVVQSRGGTTFALFNPQNPNGLRRAWSRFLTTRRVTNVNSPRYRAEDDLGSLLRMAVRSICERLEAAAKIG